MRSDVTTLRDIHYIEAVRFCLALSKYLAAGKISAPLYFQEQVATLRALSSLAQAHALFPDSALKLH